MIADRANRIRAGLGLPPLAGTQHAEARPLRPASSLRPGDVLALAIKKITGAGPCPNRCLARIQQMNAKGWLWSWRNRKLIAGWLAEEAALRGHKITGSVAVGLVVAAFKELVLQRRRRATAALLHPPGTP